MLKIKLKKSTIGCKDYQIATVKSLGLKKIGQVVEQPDNKATRGKIATVSHLLEIIEA